MANVVVAQLCSWNRRSDKDINLYINSRAARSRRHGDLRHHAYISRHQHHVHRAGGEHGSLLLTSGAKGKRYALPNARV